MAHFLEHLVFKGGQKYDDYRKVNETAERMGAVLNAYTSHDLVAFHITCRAEVAGEAIDLLTDFVGRPKIDAEELDRERGVVIQEIARAHDQPSVVAEHLIDRAAFGDHPLGPPGAGPAEHLRTFTRDAIVAFRSRQWAGSRGGAFLVGNLSHLPDDPSWPRRSAASRRSRPTAAPSRRRRSRRRRWSRHGIPTSRTCGSPTVRPSTRAIREGRAALNIYSTLLGGSMGSRLFDEIREQRGLAYSVYSVDHSYADVPILQLSAGPGVRQGGRGLHADARDRRRAAHRRAARGRVRARPRLRRRAPRAGLREHQRGGALRGVAVGRVRAGHRPGRGDRRARSRRPSTRSRRSPAASPRTRRWLASGRTRPATSLLAAASAAVPAVVGRSAPDPGTRARGRPRGGCARAGAKKRERLPDEVEVQLLGINDFHGHLERGHAGDDHPRGCARRERACPPAAPSTSPRTSALLERRNRTRWSWLGRRPRRRQPAAVVALPRRAGDRGDERDRARRQRGRQPRVRRGRRRAAAPAARRLPSERRLRRRQRASAAPTSAFLAANVISARTGRTLFPPYVIRRVGGVRIGFIGMTLEGTPEHAPAGRLERAALRRRGGDRQPLRPRAERAAKVQAIVVLLHEGGAPTARGAARRLPGAVAVRWRTSCGRTSRRGRRVPHRPHARGLRLRDRRPARDQRRLVRPADHAHRR